MRRLLKMWGLWPWQREGRRAPDRSLFPFIRNLARRAALASVISALAGAAFAGSGAEDPPDLTGLSLEELAEVDIVYAASKRPQSEREVPSFVTVLTADQIRQFGWRTLADALRSLPSFYVTDDRNYSYVGVRGFNRPGDYSTRILLLLDGLRTNNNIYDQAFIGAEFPLDVDLIDRIEVIRGPGASMYGNSAFFAVVNVVSKRGRQVQGAEAAAGIGGFGARGARATWGKRYADGFDVLASASLGGKDGERLYFPEFDTPETNHGISEGNDSEAFRSLFLSLGKNGFELEAAHAWHRKGIPTAAFETNFNDPRSRTWDESTLVQLRHDHSIGSELSLSEHLNYGRYAYSGHYAYGSDNSPDSALGESWGFDTHGTWSGLPRQVLTFGGEYQDNFKQDQKAYETPSSAPMMDLHDSDHRWALFLQDEVTLHRGVVLYAGLRHDNALELSGRWSPRFGLVAELNPATTVKLLYGQAFRAPNEYEQDYSAYDYVPNPDLRPETIRTFEAVLERQLGPGLRVTAAAFDNSIRNLISFEIDPGISQFRNVESIDSRGLEVVAEARRGRSSLRASYSYQRTLDRSTRALLTNSPRHMAKLNLGLPLGSRFAAGIESQYLSSRGTLAGGRVDGGLLTNLTLSIPRLFHGLGATATVYNLFDRRYADPGSEEHVQDAIPQARRSFRIQLIGRF
jgi:outer membrane receptor protein involved in Fe transport